MTFDRVEHIVYLRSTLIPYLLESRQYQTALDFEVCCRLMEKSTRVSFQGEETDIKEFCNEWKRRY